MAPTSEPVTIIVRRPQVFPTHVSNGRNNTAEALNTTPAAPAKNALTTKARTL